MRSFAASASLFLLFIATGNAIECEVCSNRAGMDCSGELVTCDQSVESCETAIAEYSFEGLDPIYNVFKNCSGARSKNTLYRSAEKHGSYYLRVEVCKTNGCNNGPLQFPPKNTTLNGVRCPTCSVDGELICEANDILECVGEMTSCIYIAANFRVSAAPPIPSAYRGCSSAGSRDQLPVTPADTIQDVVTAIVSKGV
uniref:Sodefrin-like factor n=1 Tax=Ichthyosaura alpestris TaxID=54263 RepID=A0A0F7JHR7_ICHAP|nr:sodefrin precursor-like factor [Ichthyosaura alpestris]